MQRRAAITIESLQRALFVSLNVLLLHPDHESTTSHSRSVLVILASGFLLVPF